MKLMSALLVVSLVSLAACSASTETSSSAPEISSDVPESEERLAVAAVPDAAVISGNDASEVSLEASQQFFESSPGAVVTDEGMQGEAASLGPVYSVPVLVDGEGVNAELERLGVQWVIAVGSDVTLDGIDVVPTVPPAGGELTTGSEPSAGSSADEQAPASESPQDSDPADPRVTVVEPQGEGLDALLALDDGQAFLAPESHDFDHRLDQVDGVVVLTDGANLAAVGTARAAGADIVESPADPRGSREAIAAAASADTVVGVFAGEHPDVEWQLSAAATGVELPGGHQLIFEGKRYIAMYGSPVTPALGILGEQDVAGTIARAEEIAEPYRALTEDTIVPAQEIIVTVAAGQAGDDGNYSNEGPIDWFIPLIEAAGEAGQYVILDFQPGRSDFLSQIQQYEELLAYPHVGIALDPEWRLGPDEMPLTRIGHVEIEEVNEVAHYLADYVRENDLPQKMIILHQFQLQMIRDRDQLDQSRSEVAFLIHADGQGSQGAKNATWHALHENAPDVAWGWKNFLDEDLPMLTPEQTFAVEPMPDFVSYQ